MSSKPSRTPKDNSTKPPWWNDGIRFQCQGSGNCCMSRGQYGFVYMTRTDRSRMANSMNLRMSDFTKRYCTKTDGLYHLKDGDGPDCLFLKDRQCSVYEGRPEQCRTWPFWPEVMNAKSWVKEVAAFCPGVGKGPLRSSEEIAAALEKQRLSEFDLVRGK